MKRVISLLLVAAICFTLAACGKKCSVEGCGNEVVDDTTFEEPLCSKHLSGKKAFETSKIAYENIADAYEIVVQYGDDIYEAWRLGIQEDDMILEEGATYLAEELSLSADEIRAGAAYALASLVGLEWEEMPEEEKSTYITYGDVFAFNLMEDELFTFCVMSVNGAYVVNGSVETAQTALDAAKTKMKELSQEYSDYEHYPNLKGYFTTTSSFFDFCNNPDGSFEQIKDTINNYRNEARDYISDLDYIFED